MKGNQVSVTKNIFFCVLLLFLSPFQAFGSVCAKNVDVTKNAIPLTPASTLNKVAQIAGGITLGATSLGLLGLSAVTAFASIALKRAANECFRGDGARNEAAYGVDYLFGLVTNMGSALAVGTSGFLLTSCGASAYGSYKLLRPFVAKQ